MPHSLQRTRCWSRWNTFVLREARIRRRSRTAWACSQVSSSTSGGKGTPIQLSRGCSWMRVPSSVAM